MAVQLIVSPPERIDMVFSNAVYVSPFELHRFHASYVQVHNGMVWPLKSDESVPEDYIAFNKLQRDAVNVKLDHTISVIPFTGPVPSLNALRLLVYSLNPKCVVTLDEMTLVQCVRSRFSDHILSRGQVFCVDFQSVLIKIVVLDLCADSADGLVLGTHGALHEHTEIVIVKR